MAHSGYWRIEWLDAKNNRRIEYVNYDQRTASKWTTYIKNVGGRVLSMTVSSRKPEGQPNVVQER